MKEAIRKRILEMVDEESRQDTDNFLLDKLRKFAVADTMYFNLSAPQRNALNKFFSEVKGVMLNELMTGNYGAEIIIDSIIVMMFEVGYRLHKEEGVVL